MHGGAQSELLEAYTGYPLAEPLMLLIEVRQSPILGSLFPRSSMNGALPAAPSPFCAAS